MCGLYGIVDLKQPIDVDHLIRKRDRLAHRGPDDSGYWIDRGARVGLAHRRLAILDLSPAGHQPMVDESSGCVLVFNGEIYNFQELRSDLESRGCRFKSQSDSEVILAAYREWGEGCLEKFNGMFAFALYDPGGNEGRATLFLARDRVGKKPLYYSSQNGVFQFASELKALDRVGALDLEALNFYLGLGYVPHDRCLFEGVHKLPPAHAARLNLETLELRRWRYWSLPGRSPDTITDGDDLVDAVEPLLMESVRYRMISDVPVGVLLSGGMDSSLVVAAAARQASRPVKTFTISFPGTPYDEADYAKGIADHFSTQHHVLEIPELSPQVMEDIFAIVDEPIADSSLIPAYIVSHLTRQHVTVALGGDGGDELFGGYTDYTTALADERRLGWIPRSLLALASKAVTLLPAGVKGRNRIGSWREGMLRQVIWNTPYFDPELRSRILTRDVVDALGPNLYAPEIWQAELYDSGRDPVDSMTRTHFGGILPDDFLVKVDRSSMAHSLEMRAPFLDYRLVEFAFARIPSKWKVTHGESRKIQKRLAKKWLPDSFNPQRKQGFSVPLNEWLRYNNCSWLLSNLDSLPPIINPSELHALVTGHARGRSNGARLYALLMLSVALRNRLS